MQIEGLSLRAMAFGRRPNVSLFSKLERGANRREHGQSRKQETRLESPDSVHSRLNLQLPSLCCHGAYWHRLQLQPIQESQCLRQPSQRKANPKRYRCLLYRREASPSEIEKPQFRFRVRAVQSVRKNTSSSLGDGLKQVYRSGLHLCVKCTTISASGRR
jgi:hypothetical protein